MLFRSYDEAVQLIATENRPSVSFLQRRLRIGYTRASILMQQLENNGVVSSPNENGNKAREILMNRSQSDRPSENEITQYYNNSMDEDELYPQAIELVRRLNKASVSLLQRRLRIGYVKASRLIDRMEAEGIIGPAKENSSKPRDVIASD